MKFFYLIFQFLMFLTILINAFYFFIRNKFVATESVIILIDIKYLIFFKPIRRTEKES